MFRQPSLLFMCKLLARVGGFGLLFFIMHWPFAVELICIGFIDGAVFFIMLMIEKRKAKKNENGYQQNNCMNPFLLSRSLLCRKNPYSLLKFKVVNK